MNKEEITVEISTKDRYYTTLPICLSSIANQTYRPKKIIIFDDGEQIDLRKIPIYSSLFAMIANKGIDLEVIFGQKRGQVYNHQAAIAMSKTEWIWRVDDDDVPESNVLELLVRNIKEDVGAISGIILDPNSPLIDINIASSRIEDIFSKPNIQWCRFNGIKEVDHINNSFLFRKSAAKHGYCLQLSPVGHREETIFTYEIKRAGYRLIIDPEAVIWHLRSPSGGIRSFDQSFFWEHDERIFKNKLIEYGIYPQINKLIVLDSGLGDHYAFKMILPELKKKYKNITLAVCYPSVFEDDTVKLISIAEAQNMEKDINKYNVYKFMMENNWKKTLSEAYLAMFL